jgi:hypothetical protein
MRQAAASLNPESQSAGEWLGWMTFFGTSTSHNG